MASQMNLSLSSKELKYILHKVKAFSSENPINISVVKKLERALKPIKVSSRKAKGRNLQQQVCKDIARIFNIEYNQQDDNCLIHSREMGQPGKDVILRGIVQERLPISIECKSTEKLKLYKAIEQAKNNMDKGDKAWLVIHKKSKQEILVTLEWQMFTILYSDLLNYYYP